MNPLRRIVPIKLLVHIVCRYKNVSRHFFIDIQPSVHINMLIGKKMILYADSQFVAEAGYTRLQLEKAVVSVVLGCRSKSFARLELFYIMYSIVYSEVTLFSGVFLILAFLFLISLHSYILLNRCVCDVVLHHHIFFPLNFFLFKYKLKILKNTKHSTLPSSVTRDTVIL